MKMCVYAMREFDELGFFQELCAEHDIEFVYTTSHLRLDTVDLAAGCDAVCIAPTTIDRPIIERLHELGVRAIANRSIGYDHVDLETSRELGIGVSQAAYDPESVANFAIMLAMMGLRKVNHILERTRLQDFSLKGKIGRDISGCTVGIVGTGRIGATVAKHLQGFGCKLLAFDLYRNPSLEGIVEYMPLDDLLAQSDVVTLHAPATAENHHMIGSRELNIMKPNALLVNTARGSLVDGDALVEALIAKKIGGACLDVVEYEDYICYLNQEGTLLDDRTLAMFRTLPNVTFTAHTAFYTETDVYQMAESAISAALAICSGEEHRLIVA